MLQDSSPLPGWEFVGPRGEAWYALTQAGDAVVVHRGPWDPSAPGSIWAAVSELRGALPSVPVWVVVRGDELRALWAGARRNPPSARPAS
ncbi:MAG: hypothetical protein R3E96_09995 [Planctomycetota bacterium]